MTALPDTLCFLDGDDVSLNPAKVLAMDRGFVFGHGAYESIPRQCSGRCATNACRKACASNGGANRAKGRGSFNLRPICEADVRAADELLLSSASKEIIPVTGLDGEQVGHRSLRGRPGPVYACLHEAYQRAVQAPSI